MTNATYTLNKDNWSGDSATIKVTNDKFKLNGCKFVFVYRTEYDDGMTFEYIECFHAEDKVRNFAVVTACKLTIEGSKYNENAYFTNGDMDDISRSDKVAEVAIFKHLFNII